MCSPPSVGNTFSKNDFCQYRVQDHVSIPKLASKSPLFGGHFRPVLFNKKKIRRLNGKWPSWEAQFRITIDFACILDRMFIISRLILLQFVKTHFPSSLRNIAPSGRPSPPGMRHVLAPSHMPIHTLQKSTRTIPPCSGSSSAAGSSVFWEGLWTMACSLYFY